VNSPAHFFGSTFAFDELPDLAGTPDHCREDPGTLSGRPEEEAEEDAMWKARAACADFEPVPGLLKAHPEILHFPEARTHFFEGNEGTLFDLSATSLYQDASPFRKALVEEFCMGFRKLKTPPYLSPLGDALRRIQDCVRAASSSRRFQVSDGADYWLGDRSVPPPAESVPPQPGPPGSKTWSFAGVTLGGGQEYPGYRFR
jgi:hypothetical protein